MCTQITDDDDDDGGDIDGQVLSATDNAICGYLPVFRTDMKNNSALHCRRNLLVTCCSRTNFLLAWAQVPLLLSCAETGFEQA